MSRLTGANQTQATSGSVHPVWLLALHFPSGTIRVCDAGKALTFGGNTYGIDGTFLGVSGVSERADQKQQAVPIRLSLTSAIKTAINADNYQFSLVDAYGGFRDEAGDLVADPVKYSSYYMSSASYSLGDGAEVLLVCEPVLVDLKRVHKVLPSAQHQKRRYAGDTFWDHAAQMVGHEFEWRGARFPTPYAREDPRADPFLSQPALNVSSLLDASRLVRIRR